MIHYLTNFIREIKVWIKIRNIVTEFKDYLNQHGFRIDWIGRIYTVINLPEEVINNSEEIKQGYIFGIIKEHAFVFEKMGITYDVAPEIRSIKNAPHSFLLIISPDYEYIQLGKFIWWLIKLVLIIIVFRIGYNLASHYGFIEKILEIISEIKQFL